MSMLAAGAGRLRDAGPAPEPRRRGPLRERDYALLWSGGLISDTGDWLLMIGLPVHVFAVTGSSLATSTVLLAELVPALVLGSFAGVLVDRWDRRRTLVAVNLAQVVLLLPLLVATTAERLWIVYAVAALQASLARLSHPAKAAILPSLVAPSQLGAANSLIAVNDNLARLVGSPLGGIVVDAFGLGGVVMLDAASFAGAAVLFLLVRPARAGAVPAGTGGGADGSAARALLRDWLDGPRVLWRSRPLRVTVLVASLAQLAQGIFVVLFVVFVTTELGGSGAEVGLLRGVQAVGGVLGGLAIGALSRRVSPRGLVGYGLLAMGLVSLATWNAPAMTTALGLYIGLFVAAGIPAVASMTGIMVTVQTLTPASHLGRVVGTMDTGANALQAVGLLLAGALADRVGVLPVVNAQAGVYLACGLIALVALRSGRAVRDTAA